MRILVTGATGFIGKRVVAALEISNHEVWRQCRHSNDTSSKPRLIPVDYAKNTDKESWLIYLQGIDVVVNCVGIIFEEQGQCFERVQKEAPIALFNACIESGVQKIIQVSALGADFVGTPRFLTTKRDADEYLRQLPIASTIFQPSIVYGPGEVSMDLFKSLAVLPIVPLINQGRTKVWPIHVDDLAAAIAEEASQLEEVKTSKRIVAVGPKQYSFRQLLVLLRVWLGYPLALAWNIPAWLSRCMGRIGNLIPGCPLNSDCVEMLYREKLNEVSPAAKTTENTRDLSEYLRQNPAQYADRLAAWRTWMAPFLRLSFSVLWIGSAYVSIFAFPHQLSFTWLKVIGIPEILQGPTLYLASAADFVLGAALLSGKNLKTVLILQVALMVCYTGIITVFLPEFWAHPFAPVLKNIPLLAATITLLILEDGK